MLRGWSPLQAIFGAILHADDCLSQWLRTKTFSKMGIYAANRPSWASHGQHLLTMHQRLQQRLSAGADEQDLWELVYLFAQNYADPPDCPLDTRALELRPFHDRYLEFEVRYGDPAAVEAVIMADESVGNEGAAL